MARFFEAWLIATAALYYLGPIPWPHRDQWGVALVVGSVLVGWRLGLAAGAALPTLPAAAPRLLERNRSLWILAAAFLALSAWHASLVTGRSLLAADSWSLAFGDAYAQFQTHLRERAARGDDALTILLLAIKAALFPLVFLAIVSAWGRSKPAFVALVAPFIAVGMLRGTDKETADVAIVVLLLMAAHGQLRRRALWALGLLAAAGFLFAERKIARFGGDWLACLPAMPEACIDPESLWARILPPSADFLRLLIVNYLTNGYEGLAHALELPFEFTWGLGQIDPIRARICSSFGAWCEIAPYAARLPEAGWDTSFRWQTAFADIASDTHWLFLPVWFAGLGALFSVSARSWQENADPFSLLFMVIAGMIFAYAPANLQVAISVEWSVLFVAVVGGQAVRVLANRAPVGSAAGAAIGAGAGGVGRLRA